MANFTDFLQRFFHTRSLQPDLGAEAQTVVLDSFQAVASTEVLIESLTSVHPATAKSPPDWEKPHLDSHHRRPATSIRALFNRAIGQSLTGRRACSLFIGAAGEAIQDLLQTAVQRHLPLVVHSHDHATAHEFANSGCFVVWATTPQEAVDFTLIARHVAELALLPALVISDSRNDAASVRLPSPTWVRDWLGAPQGEISTPTPAQQLVFGDTRRRIPCWHDLDRPVLIGAHLDALSQRLSHLSQELFFNQHMADLLGASFTRFTHHTGRHYDPVHRYRLQAAALTLVLPGGDATTAQRAADILRRQHRYKVGVLALRWRHPFPERGLVEQLSKQSRVVVLEPVAMPTTSEAPLFQAVRASLMRALENHRFPNTHPHLPVLALKALPRLEGVRYGLNGLPVDEAALVALGLQIKNHGQASPYLDDRVGTATSSYPKRQVYQESLKRLYPELTSLSVPGLKSDAPARPTPADREAPLAVRRLQITQPMYDSLTRFWEQTGVLYRDGNTNELRAEPCLAGPVMPPLSAALGSNKQHPVRVPTYIAQQCNGCGQCWTVCPDAAIGAVTSHTQNLVNNALQISNAHALQPLAGQLAAQITAMAKGAELTPAHLGDLLTRAFAQIADKLPAARRETLQAVVSQAAQTLRPLPVAASDSLFKEPETCTPNQGEWLSLAINPDACKGCGLCVNHCPTQALCNVPRTPQWVAQQQQTWTLWNALPDTSGSSIQRLAQDARWGSLPALLLSRHCTQTLVSGDDAEPGSGQKLALRYVLAVTEYLQQPRFNQFLERVNTLKNQFHEAIQGLLDPLMPSRDLGALSDLLTETTNKQDLLQQTLQNLDQRAIDKTRLQQLIAHAQGLEKLAWQLSQGPQGLGRARCGLLLVSSTVAQWAAQWPDNPFQVPVTVDHSGATEGLVGPVLTGQWQPILTDLAEVKKAKLVLDKPAQATQEPASQLNWRELDDTEQRLCPPLWLVGDENSLNRNVIQRLLEDDLPIKILLCSDRLDGNSSPPDQLGLLMLTQQRTCYMAQTALSHTDHFFTSVQETLAFPGPALLRVYTPSPIQQGFASAQTVAQAHLAVISRTMPLFRYHPADKSALESRLDLTGNPKVAEDDTPVPKTSRQVWDLLQVLAGIPLPQTTPDTPANPVNNPQAVATLKTQQESQLRELQQSLERQLKSRIHHNLLAMAGYPPEAVKKPPTSMSEDALTTTPESRQP